MIDSLPPGMILIVGALIVPLLRGRLQQAALLLLPILSALHLVIFLPAGTSIGLEYFGYQLTPIHIDRLSLVWGYIFHIAAFVAALYALHVKDSVQHVSALVYVGAAIGAVFAGDLITLFVYWELTAVSSVFLIWASRNERSYRAGMRYLIIQVGSGVLLLSGILLHFRDTGSLAFVDAFHALLPSHDGQFLGLNSPGTVLIFIAFGIKAAFPLLHNWLHDAYPEATPTGTVFLSAFTTKLAIYALARGFPGTEILIWIGATMTAFPIFYAVIENDLRRVLSYSLNNQLGFMVVGIGLANFAKYHEVAQMALNGTAAHAFAHILYKALLFMSMGAVLLRTGTIKGSELGGLYKSMPWTAGFCIVGAASISAFPLFSGFVTKSLILTAAAEEHQTVVWLILLFASAGVFHHSGIKIPFFAFFAHDSGKRVKEAPLNMLIAMGIAAALCILIGVVPGPLYAILPFDVDYAAYTPTHVITQLQLLLWSALAFTVLNLTGIYPPELRSVNLDTDWLYRRPFVRTANQSLSLAARIYASARRVRECFAALVLALVHQLLRAVRDSAELHRNLTRTQSISAMVLWVAILLTAYLVLFYVHT
jgi:multicomponent Na+:H+ antiporter subunit D